MTRNHNHSETICAFYALERVRDWLKMMAIKLFEVQGLLATNSEGDSKKDVVEVVPFACSYPE